MTRWELPRAGEGLTIGLLGGSFDPPHEGHVRITREALKRFRLDRVWWLVSPGNPLKARGPASLPARMQAARRIMRHPKVTVTDVEARLGTRYTAETLAHLLRLYPGVRFVWLMGADNLIQFDRWQDWREIMQMVPLGVLARPGLRLAARVSTAAQHFERARIAPRQAGLLPRLDPPAWCLVNVPMVDISSTELRARGHWPGGDRGTDATV